MQNLSFPTAFPTRQYGVESRDKVYFIGKNVQKLFGRKLLPPCFHANVSSFARGFASFNLQRKILRI